MQNIHRHICDKISGPCENRDAALLCAWTHTLMDSLEKGADPTSAVKSCCKTHYDDLDMDRLLETFEGRPEAFYRFLRERWNWIVTVDEDGNGLTADENKTECVCPLVRLGAADAKLLCNCSEGFAEKMFSKALRRQVKAEIRESILRGSNHCVYHLSFL